MRSLKNKPQVNPPSITYPYGQIKDDDGSGTVGTPVDEQVYGDFHQFFSQLMADGGLIANELPENEYNGFQLNTALGLFINKMASALITAAIKPITWIDVSSFGTNWGNIVGESKCQYGKDILGRVWVKGTLSCSSVPSSGAVMFTLPSGFRPPAYSSGIYPATPQLFTGSNISIVKVDSAGEVIILFPGTEVTSGTPVQLGEFTFTTNGSVA